MGDLFKQLTETKERAAAWVFRLLIILLGAAGSTLCYVVWGILTDVKTDLKSGIQQQWIAIGKINDAQVQASHDTGIATQALADHIRLESEIDNELKDLTKDHETRIRALERPH